MLLYKFMTMLPLLAFKNDITNMGWLETSFEAIKTMMLASSSLTSIVATELAAIFCIIKLVGITKDIMSDNQMGGFGAVDLPEIIRPIVLFLCIQGFAWIIQPLDTTCTALANSLEVTVSKLSVMSPSELLAVVVESTATVDNADVSRDMATGRKQSGGNNYVSTNPPNSVELQPGATEGTDQNSWGTGQIPSFGGGSTSGSSTQTSQSSFKSTMKKVGETAWNVGASLVSGVLTGIMQIFIEPRKVLEDMLAEVISWVICQLFELERFVMYVMANIYLTFLAFFGPLAFAFSILDNWKSAWVSWIGTYIEVSLWKVGISIVTMTVKLAMQGAQYVSDLNAGWVSFPPKDLMGIFHNAGTVLERGLGASTTLIFSAFICIAGMRAIRQVPRLVHVGLQLSAEAGSSDNAGGAAVATIKGTAKAVAGGAQSAAKAASLLI